MNREDLDRIGDRLHSANMIALDETVARWYRQDVPKLLAEIDRLRRASSGAK